MRKRDKQQFLGAVIKMATPCSCDCHKKGMTVIHMMPCCDKTYEKK